MSALVGPLKCAVCACLVLLIVVEGLGHVAQASGAGPESGPSDRVDPSAPTRVTLALENALVDDLNRGDEDGVVALFDPQATLEADRYATGRDEIRLWARRQIAYSTNIRIDRSEPSTGPNVAMWTASVSRKDWQAVGFQSVTMTQAIWTVGPQVVHFSMFPNDGAVVPQLGDSWRPRSSPDSWFLSQSSEDLSANTHMQPIGASLLAAAAAALLLGTLVLGIAACLRSRPTRRQSPGSLIAQLGTWQHGARHDG